VSCHHSIARGVDADSVERQSKTGEEEPP